MSDGIALAMECISNDTKFLSTSRDFKLETDLDCKHEKLKEYGAIIVDNLFYWACVFGLLRLHCTYLKHET